MNANEPRKELTNEELLTAMIGKTIRIVKFTADNLLEIEFTDGTEVELKAETIDYSVYGGNAEPILSGCSPIYMNSRDIANMPLEKDWQSLEGSVRKPNN